MCLIIASDKHSVSEETLIRAFADNPHGWGVMYSKHAKVHVSRGLEFGDYMEACFSAFGNPYIIHTRWASVGGVEIKNCHPFKITDNLWMAHNGTIRDIAMTDHGMSDSWHLAEQLKRIGVNSETIQKPTYLQCVERMIGTTNKVAMLDHCGRITLANERLWTVRDGVFYSNTESML